MATLLSVNWQHTAPTILIESDPAGGASVAILLLFASTADDVAGGDD